MKSNNTILPNESIRTALEKMRASNKKCIVAINKSNKLVGTVSDGDLRRAKFNKKSLNEKILPIFNKNPFFLYDKKYSIRELKKNLIIKYLQPSLLKLFAV